MCDCKLAKYNDLATACSCHYKILEFHSLGKWSRLCLSFAEHNTYQSPRNQKIPPIKLFGEVTCNLLNVGIFFKRN